jgi:hypothetical protein
MKRVIWKKETTPTGGRIKFIHIICVSMCVYSEWMERGLLAFPREDSHINIRVKKRKKKRASSFCLTVTSDGLLKQTMSKNLLFSISPGEGGNGGLTTR